MEYILDKNYGETVLHSDLCKLLGYNQVNDEEFKKYKVTMSRVKNLLLQFGKVLRSINGIGYYILKPKQISNHCYRTYIKSASRMYNKSKFILDRVDYTELTKDRIEELQNMLELNKNLIENVDKMITESTYYSRKDYYDNLDDV
jgi:hypothetical protein